MAAAGEKRSKARKKRERTMRFTVVCIAAVSVAVIVCILTSSPALRAAAVLAAGLMAAGYGFSVYLGGKDFSDVKKALDEEPFSARSAELVNVRLMKEKDSRKRAWLRDLGFRAKLYDGDFVSAFRFLYRDEELFSADTGFELIYLSDLIAYYVLMGSTTGATEYSEEAYRSFVRIFKEGGYKGRYDMMQRALAVEMYSAYHHEEWAGCAELALWCADEAGDGKGLAAAQRTAALLFAAEAECSLGNADKARALCGRAAEEAPTRYLSDRAESLMKKIKILSGE
ncbi:MAG: hypothetical protein IIU25_01905 [Oscillospiraceae bacterium]|nr:hypothetical protein [Oscillospiraceae bacterium]